MTLAGDSVLVTVTANGSPHSRLTRCPCPNVSAAVTLALAELERLPNAHSAHLWRQSATATLHRAPGRSVVLTGAPMLVAAARPALLRCGWRQAAEDGTTSFLLLRPALPKRVFNCLARDGYTTIEQVAAVTDDSLLDITNMGPKSVRQVRSAIAALNLPEPTPTTVLDAAQIAELTAVLTEMISQAGPEHAGLAQRAASLRDAIQFGRQQRAAPKR